MPPNPGHAPALPLVDIKFRGGHIRRSTDPAKWRWKAWGSGESDFDIVHYQPSKGD